MPSAPGPATGASAVAAVIVNYNAGPCLEDAVASVRASSGLRPAVRVVDNASTDRSGERLRSLYAGDPAVEVLFNPENLGFARAVNAAAASLEAPFILVLNPDCRLDPDALGELRAALEQDPRAAVAGAAVVDRRGRPERAAVRHLPTPRRAILSATGLAALGRWWPALEGMAVPSRRRPGEVATVEAISGACLLIRRTAWDEIGGFDEGYPLHCEDLDLFRRLADAGWHCLYVPTARVVHEGGVSSRSRAGWVHTQKHRGMSRYLERHHRDEVGWLGRQALRAGIWGHWLVTRPLVWLRR